MKYVRLSLALFILVFISNNYSQDVPYVPTPYNVVEEMLALAEVNENDIVYDLGCGDGRIVVTAAKNYGATGIGIDSNPERIKESKENAEKNNVKNKVEFKQQDLFKTDLTDATVLTLYLLNSVNLRLRPKLFEELKPGTRIVSHSFDMGDWKPDEKRNVGGRSVYFWKMPANFSGKWDIEMQGNNSDKYTLDLKQQFQNVDGTLQEGGKKFEIKDVKADGNKIEFAFNENGSSEEMKFEGELKDENLNGKIISSDGNHNFTASRQNGTMSSLDPTGKSN